MDSAGRNPVAGDTVSSTSIDGIDFQGPSGLGPAASFMSSTASTASPEDVSSPPAVGVLHAEPAVQEEQKSLGQEKSAWVIVRTFTPA